MFPFIQTVEEARAAVSYTRLIRPTAFAAWRPVHRGSRYGRVLTTTSRRRTTQIAVVLQLETPEAIERLAEIAAVPGVDSLFVGPGDLSAAMGRIGEVGHPEVQTLIAKAAAELAHAAGKPIGIVGPNPDMVSRFLEYGYDWVAVASDMALMTGRAVDWVTAHAGATRLSAAPAAAY